MYNVCLFLCFDVVHFYCEATHDKWIAKEHTKGFLIAYTFESKTDAASCKGHKLTNSIVMWNTKIQFEADATVIVSCFTYFWVFNVPLVACMAPNVRTVNNS
jgi:hypothetical protein